MDCHDKFDRGCEVYERQVWHRLSLGREVEGVYGGCWLFEGRLWIVS